MELNKLTVALVASCTGFYAQADSAPISQTVEINPYHSHESHSQETHSQDASVDVGPSPKRSESNDLTPALDASPRVMTFSQQAVVECDVSGFATTNTNTLISQITSQGAECVNDLFAADSATQVTAFDSNNMYYVAKHATELSRAYQGGGSDELEALFLYLRAGYYAEFYNDGVSLLSWVTSAVKEAVDTFVANEHFYDSNDAHGKVLGEVITTMDSATLQHEYLDVINQWLLRWNGDYEQHWNMRGAVNGIFTLLYRGQWNNGFKVAIAKRDDLVKNLSAFAKDATKLGSNSEFMAVNAGRELARMTQYTNTQIEPLVTTELSTLFTQYSMYGTGDAVWLAAADVASYYSDCANFGICGFEAELKGLVLSQTYTCSDTIRILSQDLTAIQQQAACDKMGFEETYFHGELQTGNQPVADDHNTQLQVNIFNSSDDYRKYAGPIFDIDTNNGGMYLEGDPSIVGNVPNFVAYEASYANPDHFIWNLEHEYVHYLDGRFDMYGNFTTPTEKVVWWSEGVAEYISKENDNQAALDTIEDGTHFTLKEIFETTYDGFDVDRIYRWGYLAVRFMFEKHEAELANMLVETRRGDWAAYKAHTEQWATQYQSEFEQWTQQLVGGMLLPQVCDGSNAVSDGRVTAGEPICLSSSAPLWLSIEGVNAVSNIAISTAHGSGDLTLSYSNGGWPTGDASDVVSSNIGNGECIVLSAQSDYWGYIKVAGEYSDATLVVDFDATTCRR
ncbi:collagenase [Vibrio sp. ZSDZ65]|uniref:microbial collagenase n=1 Tax=Vibrio qingdaonensis TaxID=2829491 RepID=A0A9X3CR40_9VIBR|nr:collagenase [Vibrio qingdaonensis]MCW8347941.1 collagenase [Vibrio qingdaonensis]